MNIHKYQSSSDSGSEDLQHKMVSSPIKPKHAAFKKQTFEEDLDQTRRSNPKIQIDSSIDSSNMSNSTSVSSKSVKARDLMPPLSKNDSLHISDLKPVGQARNKIPKRMRTLHDTKPD